MTSYITLQADFNYPNNTHSEFYSVLSEEIILNNKKLVGLSEFIYPNNYEVNLGTITLNIPSCYDFNNNKLENYSFFSSKLMSIEEKSDLFLSTFDSIQIDETNTIYQVMLLEYTIQLQNEFNDYFMFVKKHILDFDNRFYFEKFISILDNLISVLHNYHMNEFVVEINGITNIFETLQKNLNEIITTKTNFVISINLMDNIEKEKLTEILTEKFKHFMVLENKKFYLKSFVDMYSLDPNLNKIFTFDKEEKFLQLKSKKRFLFTTNFLITTNIIQDSFFCNKPEPILQIIKPKEFNEEISQCVFEPPHFRNINKTRLNKIFIKITDQNNQVINFLSGPVILKLCIKK